MEAGAPGYGPVCDAVAQFEAALFEHTTNWGSYLSAAVLEAETVDVYKRQDRQSLRALPIFLQIAFRKQKTEVRRGFVPLFLLRSSNHFSTAPRFALVTMRA